MEYIICFFIALIVAFFTTPLVKKFAVKINAIDIPKDERRMHSKPIPLAGGLAIFLGILIAISYSIIISKSIIVDKRLLGIAVGAIIIITMGLLDDVYTLKPLFKFIFQLSAAIAVVMISDFRIEFITDFFGKGTRLPLSPIISYGLTLLWIVGITNAINLIDGLDGLSSGISAICATSLFFVTILRMDSLPPSLTLFIGIFTISIAGACLGFIPHNFYPASIFIGETGAAFLGFMLATISIQGTLKSYTAISLLIPLLVLGLPLFDTLFAIFRRISKRKHFFEGDREHLHHKLVDSGLSQKQSVLILYSSSLILGGCAVVMAIKGITKETIVLAILSVCISGAIAAIGKIRKSAPISTEDNNKDEEN